MTVNFRTPFLFLPVQQASQLVSHVDHHDLLASIGQAGDPALDGLGHTGVDGATETTIRGHADDQMLAGLLLRGFDLGLLVQGWREQRGNGGGNSVQSRINVNS